MTPSTLPPPWKAKIRAARKVQGARSRKRATIAALFETCSTVREAIKRRYRAPRFAGLRRQFGYGLSVNQAKPPTVLDLANLILASAILRPDALREAGIRPPTLDRIRRLRRQLAHVLKELPDLKRQRRELRAAPPTAPALVRIEDLPDDTDLSHGRIGADAARCGLPVLVVYRHGDRQLSAVIDVQPVQPGRRAPCS